VSQGELKDWKYCAVTGVVPRMDITRPERVEHRSFRGEPWDRSLIPTRLDFGLLHFLLVAFSTVGELANFVRLSSKEYTRLWRCCVHSKTNFAVLLIALLVITFGCKSKESVPARNFDFRGKVVSVDKDKSEVMVAHDEIKGYMAAMTMSFKVKDRWALDVVKPGDQLTATLTVADDAYLENISVTQSTGEPPSSGTAHEPSAGDQVPNFKFVNQDGKPVAMENLRGRPLLLTFIYTRCPLPDYCIRMSDNFAMVARELQKSDTYSRVQLLSISIDPEYDKPQILKSYGKRYAASVDPQFSNWQFVSGSIEATRNTAEWFGLTYIEENDQIVHSLRTAVIAPDGKFVEMYRGNEWKPSDAAEKLKQLSDSTVNVRAGSEAPTAHRH
jgi:protein SCO1